MRAERELELDQSLVIQYDPRERWWGVEVDFSPALDDLFGVTNNKQSARNFADLAKNDLEVLLKNKTLNRGPGRVRENGDPRGPLLAIINDINNHIVRMRDLIKAQTAGARTVAAPPMNMRLSRRRPQGQNSGRRRDTLGKVIVMRNFPKTHGMITPSRRCATSACPLTLWIRSPPTSSGTI